MSGAGLWQGGNLSPEKGHTLKMWGVMITDSTRPELSPMISSDTSPQTDGPPRIKNRVDQGTHPPRQGKKFCVVGFGALETDVMRCMLYGKTPAHDQRLENIVIVGGWWSGAGYGRLRSRLIVAPLTLVLPSRLIHATSFYMVSNQNVAN